MLRIMIFVHVLVEVCSLHQVQVCVFKAADKADEFEVFFTGVARFPQASEPVDDDTLIHTMMIP